MADNQNSGRQLTQADLEQRFDSIMSRIAQTERGREMMIWLAEKKIPVTFRFTGKFITRYTEEESPEGSAKAININWNMPDDAIIVTFYREARRAWHQTLEVTQVKDTNLLSNLLKERFTDADAKAFAIAMALDHEKQTGESALVDMLDKDRDLMPRAKHARETTKGQNASFEDTQRAAFDGFFVNMKNVITAHETKRTEDHLERVKALFTKQTEGQVRAHIDGIFEDRANARNMGKLESYKDKDLVLSNQNTAFNTIKMAELCQYGQRGFGNQSRTNYLTDIKGQADIKDDFYIKTDEEIVKGIDDFVKEWKLSTEGMNFLGTPANMSDEDIMLQREVAKLIKADKEKAEKKEKPVTPSKAAKGTPKP